MVAFLSGGLMGFSFFFFFQAEDGIRDVAVTGVQTCALPISIAAAPRAAFSLSIEILEDDNLGAREEASHRRGLLAWARRRNPRAVSSVGPLPVVRNKERSSRRCGSRTAAGRPLDQTP